MREPAVVAFLVEPALVSYAVNALGYDVLEVKEEETYCDSRLPAASNTSSAL